MIFEHVDTYTLLNALNELAAGGAPSQSDTIRSLLDDTGWTKDGVLIPLPAHVLGQKFEMSLQEEGDPIWQAHVKPFTIHLFFGVLDDCEIQLRVEVYMPYIWKPILSMGLAPEDDLVAGLQALVASQSQTLQMLQEALSAPQEH